MSDLPPGWEWTTLGEIASSVRNGIFVSRPGSEPDGVPILRISAVRPLELQLDDLRYSGKPADALRGDDSLLKPGDLLFTRYSGTRDYVGVCARVPDGIGDLTYPDKLIRVRTPGVDPKYVALAFASPLVRSSVESVLRTTAGQVGISGGALKGVRLPIAPLAEQRRIVAIAEDHLSRLDAGQRSIAGAIKRAEKLWRSILDELSKSYAPMTRLGDVAEVQGGIQKQQKRRPIRNKYPFLRVANVPRGRLDLAEMHEVELFDGELDRYVLRRGDLLIVEGNGSPDQIGRAAMWHGEIENCVHQNHLIRARPDKCLLPEYLELLWNAPAASRQLQELASSSSGLHTLSTVKVKSIGIPLPDLDVQRRLVASAEEWREHIVVSENSLTLAGHRAQLLRRSLLANAFAGRLAEQDPDDEPASVLLGRIRAERASRPKVGRGRRSRVAEAGQGSLL